MGGERRLRWRSGLCTQASPARSGMTATRSSNSAAPRVNALSGTWSPSSTDAAGASAGRISVDFKGPARARPRPPRGRGRPRRGSADGEAGHRRRLGRESGNRRHSPRRTLASNPRDRAKSRHAAGCHARIPCVVEAWAELRSKGSEPAVEICVNRSPITGDVEAAHQEKQLVLFGCGLSHSVTENCPKTVALQGEHHHAVHASDLGREVAGLTAVREPDHRRRRDQGREEGEKKRRRRALRKAPLRKTSSWRTSTMGPSGAAGTVDVGSGKGNFSTRSALSSWRP